MGFLSKIFDPGKGDRDKAGQLAEDAIIKGGSTSGPGGIGVDFDFSDGQGNLNLELGSFNPLLTGFQDLSQSGIAQAQGGLPTDFTQLGGATQDRLGQINVNQFGNEQNFNQLQQLIQGNLGTAGADPFDLGADISSRLRSLSERRNNRLVNKTFDRLKRSGRLGTTGGAGIAAELDANLFDQGLKFDLAGLEAGRGFKQDAIGNVFGGIQGREQIGARQFGESFGLEELGGQRALQQFGVGSSMFDTFLQNQQQGANIGFAAGGAAASTAQIPLAFANAQAGLTGQSSASGFDAAGVLQQNAAMAKSPIFEAIKAAGQFAGNIALPGVGTALGSVGSIASAGGVAGSIGANFKKAAVAGGLPTFGFGSGG